MPARTGQRFSLVADLEEIIGLIPTCNVRLLWAYDPEVKRAIRCLRLAIENSQGPIQTSIFDELLAPRTYQPKQERNNEQTQANHTNA